MIMGFNSENKDRVEVIKASDIKIFKKNITITGNNPYVETEIQLPYGWNGTNTIILGSNFRLPGISIDPYPWATEQQQEFVMVSGSTQNLCTLLKNLVIHGGESSTGYIECIIQVNGMVYGTSGFDSILKVAVMHFTESE